MDPEDLEPRKAAPKRRDLETLSVAALEGLIAELEAEIARVRAAIAGKQAARKGADAFFKR